MAKIIVKRVEGRNPENMRYEAEVNGEIIRVELAPWFANAPKGLREQQIKYAVVNNIEIEGEDD